MNNPVPSSTILDYLWNAALCEAVWPSMSFCPITLCTINLLFRSLLLFELFIAIITVLFSHYDDYFNWSTYCSTDFDSLYMPIHLYMYVYLYSVYEVLSIMFYGKWQRNRKRCFINRLACDTITCTIMVRNISYILKYHFMVILCLGHLRVGVDNNFQTKVKKKHRNHMIFDVNKS